MTDVLATRNDSTGILGLPLEVTIQEIRQTTDRKALRRKFVELSIINEGLSRLSRQETAEAIQDRDDAQLKLSALSLELGAQISRQYDAVPDAPTGAAVHHNNDFNSSTMVDELTGKEQFLADVGVTRAMVAKYRKLAKYEGELADLVISVAETETKAVTLGAALKVIQAERKDNQRKAMQTAMMDATVATEAHVWHGDMRVMGARIADNSVDLILTDPPYPGEFLPLLVYSGQIFLPEVMTRLSASLAYVWTCAIRHSGGNQRIFKANVNTAWKPVIVLCKPPLSIWWESFIDVVSGGREKDLHKWQQAESEAAYFIEHLSLPGQVVVDPFCGSGTVLNAAKQLGRQYQGIEMDGEHVQRACDRLAQ